MSINCDECKFKIYTDATHTHCGLWQRTINRPAYCNAGEKKNDKKKKV